MIETDRLTKRYGEVRGIEEVSLSVEPGEVFGFLGPNGAGKTTTIRTLLDLLHPTSGSARLFGLDSHADSRAIRARVGNLPGEFAFDERLTGRQALEVFAALRGVDDLSRAEALAERFEADLSRRIGELSRGNRQKVGLVQALFHAPELLLLDEPTGGLDPLMQEEFLTVVGEERERGATVFLSSHELDEVQRVCDRVAIIREGRIVAVEEVARMRERAYRDVIVRFAAPVDLEPFGRLEGVSALRADDSVVHFHVEGPIDPVVKALARHEVRDLEMTRPSLEELFLTFYRTENGS